jgi:succinate dehydrogenase hydrophobic anchor subunit
MRARAVRPGLSFEYLMWIFTRLSAVALIVLALIGLAGALSLGARAQVDLATLMRWTFFPNANHVVNSNIPDVYQGWVNGLWRNMQMLIILFGATHGFNGLRAILDDFLAESAFKPLIRGLIFLLWLFVLLMAIAIILSGN